MTDTTDHTAPVAAGVIGVGAMGANHARVYSELRNVELVGVTDLDTEAAERVSRAYDTAFLECADLLEACDVVTVAVPTHAHFETVSRCLEAGVHVLVEKPIAETVTQGRAVAREAREAGVCLQVGHIERFNPAVETLEALMADLDVIAIEAERLGPPVERTALGDVTTDLMIHDVDVVSSLLEPEPTSITAMGTDDGQYATATMEYDDVIVSLTASRRTQKKIRRLTVTATDCLVEVDYIQQSVLIHRDSYPKYVTDDGRKRFRHESVIERPRVENAEPLKRELESFIQAATNGTEPVVSAEDGVAALEIIQQIDRLATQDRKEVIAR